MKKLFKTVYDFYMTLKQTKKLKTTEKRVAKFQSRIARYEASNKRRLKDFESFNSGFAEDAINKDFKVELLVLARLDQMVFYRAEAKAVFSEYLREEIDDSQLHIKKIMAYAKYSYLETFFGFNDYWVYKDKYFVTLGALPRFGYFDSCFFFVSPSRDGCKAPLTYIDSWYILYSEFYVYLSQGKKPDDLLIYALGYKAGEIKDKKQIKHYEKEPCLDELFSDIKKYRKIKDVEF